MKNRIQAPALRLLGAELKGISVLFLHDDPAHAALFEARAEQDSELQRVTVYSASNLETARSLARKFGCTLCIYKDGFSGCDFVTIQVELKNAQPSIELIPLLGVPNIQQLKESRRIGNVVDFGDISGVDAFEGFKELILNYARENTRGKTASKLFQLTSDIQKALLIEHPEWVGIKALSRQIINDQILLFDFGNEESALVCAAEEVYVPWASSSDLSTLLSGHPDTLAILNQTGSWRADLRVPKSAAGMLITLANYCAEKINGVTDTSAIIAEVRSRPQFLKHPSIRTVEAGNLESLITSLSSSTAHLKMGSGSS